MICESTNYRIWKLISYQCFRNLTTSGNPIFSNFYVLFRSSLSTNRTIVQSIAFGGVAGVLCHFWYNHLDKMYSAGHRQIKVVAKKILCDQIIFSPICIVACLIAACVLNGRDKEKIYEEVYRKGKLEFAYHTCRKS